MPRIFAYIAHNGGIVDDSAAELAAAARAIDAAEAPIAVVTGWGSTLDAACESLRCSFREVWKIADEALVYPDAELVRKALVNVLPAGSIVLVAHNHFGVDLSPGLSVRLHAAYVPDVLEIVGVSGTSLTLVRQEFGGQLNTHVRCDISGGAVLNLRPGAFQPLDLPPVSGQVRGMAAGPLEAKRRHVCTTVAESGDVDITKYKVLVSIGRGIQDPENIPMAQELADAVGGAVSCSRPVVDARWLDKSRQVGSSGKTVKPKVYLACGISGSFQHLAGIRGNPLIVAINKNPKAPIFRAARIGIVDDILEFLPELTGRVLQERGVSAR